VVRDVWQAPQSTAQRLYDLAFTDAAQCEDVQTSSNTQRTCYMVGSRRQSDVPVGLQLSFDPMKLLIHPDYDEMTTLIELEYTLQCASAPQTRDAAARTPHRRTQSPSAHTSPQSMCTTPACGFTLSISQHSSPHASTRTS
jgi:hypothetical protein